MAAILPAGLMAPAAAHSPDPIARLRDGTEVAAWIFKAKPEVWDVLGAIRALHADPGAPPIDSWSMATTYRVDLVRAGQRCLLWVTGGRRDPNTGVWGVGHIASDPWLEPAERDGPLRSRVDLDLVLAERPVPLSELAADERFARSEIIRAPRVSSPVAVTGPELDAVEDAWSTAFPQLPGGG